MISEREEDQVVSKTLEKPIWRDATIIRDHPIAAIRALKAEARQEHPHRRQRRLTPANTSHRRRAT